MDTVEGKVITVDALVQIAKDRCNQRANQLGVKLYLFNENGLKSVMEQILQVINWNNQSSSDLQAEVARLKAIINKNLQQ